MGLSKLTKIMKTGAAKAKARPFCEVAHASSNPAERRPETPKATHDPVAAEHRGGDPKFEACPAPEARGRVALLASAESLRGDTGRDE